MLSGTQAVADTGTSKTDSVKLVLAGLSDTPEKADNLLLLAKLYTISQDFDSALSYCNKADSISLLINYDYGIAESVFRRGLIHDRANNYIDAMSSFRKYLSLIEPLNDEKRLIYAYYYYARSLRLQGDFDSAIYYYRNSLHFSKKTPDDFQLIALYTEIGNSFQEITSELDSATYYYIQALELCQATGREATAALIYNNLGKTFTFLGDYEEALKYLELALEINEKYNNTREKAMNLLNIGLNYGVQRMYEPAIEFLDKAYALLIPYGEIRGVIDIYSNYAVFYKELGKYELAIEYHHKVLAYYLKHKQVEPTLTSLRNLAGVYSQLGNYKLAIFYLDSGLSMASRTGFRRNQLYIYDLMYRTYYKSGDMAKAYDYMGRYYTLKDSLFDIDKTEMISDLKLKYEKELDQARILALEKDNIEKDLDLQKRTTQRNAYLYTALTIIFIAAFLFLYIRQRTVKDEIIVRQKIQQLEEEKKLMAAKLLLEGQENERKRIASELHDGLGVLLSATKMQFSSIIDKSPDNKELIDKATKMLEQASGDVRKISHNMMPGLLTRLGFYEAVEDLFENINETNGLVAVCSILGNTDGRLAENREIMLYRIVQEMVNNTLKHAGAENIKLQVQVLPEMLDITYVDDGIGFDFKQKLEAESLGLKSIKSRVDFLNGIISVDSNPGEGAKYNIQVPL